MNTFSTTEIAKILEVSPAWVRAQARGALVSPTRTGRGHFRYSFQDVVLLRAARRLRRPGVSAHRVRNALRTLSDSLPAGRSMSSLRLASDGRAILVGDEAKCWDAESGQLVLSLERDTGGRRPAPLEQASTRPTRTASDWFNIALESEHRGDDADAAMAYERACELDPQHAHARINLGRLKHATGDLAAAERHYRAALDSEPQHPIALFNLGVALEDQGETEAAIEIYHRAVDADSEIAEAHYNLARLYANQSEQMEAVRHYSRYKILTKHNNQ